MTKNLYLLLITSLALSSSACGIHVGEAEGHATGEVSQEEYDKVVQKHDDLVKKYNDLLASSYDLQRSNEDELVLVQEYDEASKELLTYVKYHKDRGASLVEVERAYQRALNKLYLLEKRISDNMKKLDQNSPNVYEAPESARLLYRNRMGDLQKQGQQLIGIRRALREILDGAVELEQSRLGEKGEIRGIPR